MKSNLTRRRFGQLAIASTAVAMTGYFANKTLAQRNRLNTPDSLLPTGLLNVIYGVKVEDSGLIVQTLNLASLLLSTVSGLTNIILDPGDQLTGFTTLSNGTLVVSINPSRTNKKDEYPPRLIFLGPSPRTVTVTGLKDKQSVLGDILGTNGGSLVGLVSKSNGTPPVKLASINTSTGAADIIDSFPGNQRVRNLAESPNGTIYTTTVDKDGNTVLGNKQLVLDNNMDNHMNNNNWVSGLRSLVSSSSSEFYGLGTTRYGLTNYLYKIDATTGNMTQLREFPVNKMTSIRV